MMQDIACICTVSTGFAGTLAPGMLRASIPDCSACLETCAKEVCPGQSHESQVAPSNWVRQESEAAVNGPLADGVLEQVEARAGLQQANPDKRSTTRGNPNSAMIVTIEPKLYLQHATSRDTILGRRFACLGYGGDLVVDDRLTAFRAASIGRMSMVGWDGMQWNPSFKCLGTSNAGITLRSIPAYGPRWAIAAAR